MPEGRRFSSDLRLSAQVPAMVGTAEEDKYRSRLCLHWLCFSAFP